MLDFLDEMGFLNGSDIVSVDGINFNGRDNGAKYGRSLHGHEAFVLQLSINGVSYAVMAAMSDDGFIAWTIYDGAVSGSHVAEFISTKVIPRLRPNQIILLDNAPNQSTPEVVDALMEKNRYNVPYCPELNPIERGFSLIRSWIRAHEHEYYSDPLGLINAAFHIYSIHGALGNKCYHFFDLYRQNHLEWIN